jgi:uncharacterized protein (UPF0276 family)
VGYDDIGLARVARNVMDVQDALGRRIPLENPATYLRFETSDLSEVQFLSEVAHRSGCGLLLDAANVHVSAVNHGFSAEDYINAFPIGLVEEIHLAGHAEDADEDGERLLIDAHCAPVPSPVWALYRRILDRRGPVATLIEWDNDLPACPGLLEERRHWSGETTQQEARA